MNHKRMLPLTSVFLVVWVYTYLVIAYLVQHIYVSASLYYAYPRPIGGSDRISSCPLAAMLDAYLEPWAMHAPERIKLAPCLTKRNTFLFWTRLSDMRLYANTCLLGHMHVYIMYTYMYVLYLYVYIHT